MGYKFTNNWFEITAKSSWDKLIPQLNPRRILEIGSYEGAAVCYLINHLASSEASLVIHCVDSWVGGAEHQAIDMGMVEDRFRHNIDVAITDQIRSTTRVMTHKSL